MSNIILNPQTPRVKLISENKTIRLEQQPQSNIGIIEDKNVFLENKISYKNLVKNGCDNLFWSIIEW